MTSETQKTTREEQRRVIIVVIIIIKSAAQHQLQHQYSLDLFGSIDASLSIVIGEPQKIKMKTERERTRSDVWKVTRRRRPEKNEGVLLLLLSSSLV